MEVKIILRVLLFLPLTLCVIQQPYNNQKIQIQGNTNQQIEVNFKYDKIISVRPSNGSLPDYISLLPTRFKIMTIKQQTLLPDINRTLMDELRTPFSNQYTNIFFLNRSLVAFSHPSHFLFFQEKKDSFSIQKQYQIKQMLNNNQAAIQIIEDNFIIVTLSHSEMVVFDGNFLFKQSNVFNTTEEIVIRKIEENNNSHFISVVQNCIVVVEVTNGTVDIVSSIDLQSKIEGIEVSAFLIGEKGKNGLQVWLLDENKGLYFTLLNENLAMQSGPTLISSQMGCFDLDSKSQKHSYSIVLTCMKDKYNIFKILLFDNDKFRIPFLLSTTEATNQRSSASKFLFFKNYIYSQEAASLDVFTPGLGKGGFQKNWVTFSEISSVVILEDKEKDNIFVYTVHKGVVGKKELVQQPYSLVLYCQEPVNTKLIFIASYFCQKGANRQPEICESQILLDLNIHNNIVSYVQYKSMNMAIILILTTTLLALILLCRYKYKIIYRTAYLQFKELSNPTKCRM